MTIGKHKSSKKRIRNNKSHRIIEKIYFYDEEAFIFRTEAGGKYWSVSFWIPEEKKEYRRSLKTKDKVTALKKAKEKFLSVRVQIKNGKVMFDKKVCHLMEKYIAFQWDEAKKAKRKTEGRVKTIESQLKHFVEFVGLNTKVNNIDPTKFIKYVQFRRSHYPNVQNVTLVNEISTIKNLLAFAQKRGFLSREVEWDFGCPLKKKANRRAVIEHKHYKRMYKWMRGWNKEETDRKVIEQKEFVRHFILIMANSGLRFGELRRLQWKDISVKTVKDNGEDVKLMHIDIGEEKTKNKQQRKIIGRSGEVIERLKDKVSKWTNNDDLLFVDNDTGEPIHKKVYYKYWGELMNGSGLRDEGYT